LDAKPAVQSIGRRDKRKDRGGGKKEILTVKDPLIFMGGLEWKSKADNGEGCCQL